MSLEYSLIIEGNIDISDVKQLLITIPEFKEVKGEIEAPGLLVDITVPRGLVVDVIEDEFGFSPSLDISFQLDKFADSKTSYRQIMQGIWSVLNSIQGEAVVLFNGESIILERKNGKLYLNEIDNFWYEGTLPTNQLYDFTIIASI